MSAKEAVLLNEDNIGAGIGSSDGGADAGQSAANYQYVTLSSDCPRPGRQGNIPQALRAFERRHKRSP